MPDEEEWIRNDGMCFGCGQANERGLRLAFRPVPGGVEALYEAPAYLRGPDGVVHGGVQAALLDEVLGMAAHVGSGRGDEHLVTVEFALRYRRPVPVEAAIAVRGRLVRVEGRDYFVEGEIAGADGEVLTRATARWRRIDPAPASVGSG